MSFRCSVTATPTTSEKRVNLFIAVLRERNEWTGSKEKKTAVDAPTVLFMTFINFELDFSCSDNVSRMKHIWITIYIQLPNVLHEFLAKNNQRFFATFECYLHWCSRQAVGLSSFKINIYVAKKKKKHWKTHLCWCFQIAKNRRTYFCFIHEL